MRTLLLLSLAATLTGCPKKGPKTVELTAPQDMTLELLNAWTAEVCALIEEESGGTFTKTPHVRLATPTELRQVVVDEAVAMDRIRYPKVPERVLRERYAGMPIAGILGKYGIFTDVMYVDTDTIWSMALEEGGPEQVPLVAKVLLAHELTHALQAQYGDASARWDELPDNDALEAFRSVTEGQASWVERRVATRLDADHVAEAMIEGQGWSFDNGAESAMSFRLWSAYGQGDVWMQSLYDEGGFERQWLMVREPPSESAMVFGSRPYAHDYREPPEGWREQFAGLEAKLGQGSWSTSESRLGEVDLRQMLFAYGEHAYDDIAAIEYGWSRTADLPDRQVQFQRLRFENEDQAHGYLELMFAEPHHQPDEQVERLDFADEAVKIVQAPGSSTGMGTLARDEVHTWWFRKGREVFALHCLYFRPGLRAPEVLTAMLALVEEE
ncbi:MAG: hypothetical protein EP330_05455 [Deltaproteobacteria bacterium]|nr:MAG: hypothetical protein EP330_05455 [Deltaproteobacteria bacterium]